MSLGCLLLLSMAAGCPTTAMPDASIGNDAQVSDAQVSDAGPTSDVPGAIDAFVAVDAPLAVDAFAPSDAPASIAIAGSYTDGFGTHTVSNTRWQMGGGFTAGFAISRFDNSSGFALAQNDTTNMFSPSMWSRFEWFTVGTTLYPSLTGVTIVDAIAITDGVGTTYGGAAIPAGQASTYKTFKQAPKACGFAGAGPFGNPLEFGDWIFPKTSILGITASGFSPALNSVLSTEIAFQKDRSFNYGVDGGKYGPNITPGAFGIIQKNVLTMMFRVDHNVDLTNIIGTSRPSFGSIQFFNTQILDYKASDEIVQLAYWNRTRAKNSALLTGILAMNYSNDRINPSIAAGWDVSYGGGFLIPAVEWVLGDKWRLKAELDLFYSSGNEKKRYLNPATFQLEEQGRGAGLLGYFSGANQALLRLTRQF